MTEVRSAEYTMQWLLLRISGIGRNEVAVSCNASIRCPQHCWQQTRRATEREREGGHLVFRSRLVIRRIITRLIDTYLNV